MGLLAATRGRLVAVTAAGGLPAAGALAVRQASARPHRAKEVAVADRGALELAGVDALARLGMHRRPAAVTAGRLLMMVVGDWGRGCQGTEQVRW